MFCNRFNLITVICLKFLVNINGSIQNEKGSSKHAEVELKMSTSKLTSNIFAPNVTYSPEWINYQKERFNIDDKLNDNHLNKLFEEKENILNRSRNDNNNYEKLTDENNGQKSKVVLNFMEYLKSLSMNLWSYSDIDHLNNKVKLLNTFSNNLLKIIESQFSLLWLKDDEKNIRRQKRGVLNEASLPYLPEASLISICFLTFSVFLIKLVLQVVNIIKTRRYTLNGNTLTNTRVA